jgi:cyanophycinase-like exopeptidase
MARGLLLALAVGLTAGSAPAQSHHPGPVVLLGESAKASAVPELAEPPDACVLLVAGGAVSPQPLDARAWGGDERTRIVRLAKADEAEVDRELVANVRAAQRIAFGPGTPKEWLDALLERGRPSALMSAVHEAWNGGALIVGRGDSAALLSAGFVVNGPDDLGWKVHNPRDAGGSRAASGLSYQPWAMLDTEGRSGGDLRRLLRSVCNERIELALYLPASAALAVDVTRSQLTVRGEGIVTIVDAKRVRRLRDRVEGVRLARLPTGTVWDAAERRIALEGELAAEAEPQDERTLQVDDVFDSSGLTELSEIPPRIGGRWVRVDRERRLELSFDASSRWGRAEASANESSRSSQHWVDGLACDLNAADL